MVEWSDVKRVDRMAAGWDAQKVGLTGHTMVEYLVVQKGT
jgi:hypothetical protein